MTDRLNILAFVRSRDCSRRQVARVATSDQRRACTAGHAEDETKEAKVVWPVLVQKAAVLAWPEAQQHHCRVP